MLNKLRFAVLLAGFVAVSAPALAAQWVAGHYGPEGHWHVGHWVGGTGPAPGPLEGPPGRAPHGFHWAGGYYGPHGAWHRGHWVRN